MNDSTRSNVYTILLGYLLVVALMPRQAFAADTLELDFVVPFQNPISLPYTFRTDMDCEREAGFNIRDAAYLKRDLNLFLKQRNISITDNAPLQLRLYVTHDDCGTTGEEKYRSYPLGLGVSESDIASANLRIIAELQKRQSGEIVAMHEYITVATLEKNVSRFLAFYLTAEQKQVTKRGLWKPLAKELAERIAEDIRGRK